MLYDAGNNKLKEDSGLCQQSSSQFEKLIVEFNEDSCEQFSDMRWIMKLKTNSLKQLSNWVVS